MKLKLLFASAVLIASVSALQAQVIFVNNFSFEQPGTAKITGWNGESGVDVPGWASDTAATDSGVESDWPGHTDGLWTGFLYNYDASIWNLTSHQIMAGETFTLLVDARDNWTSAGTPALRISLYYDIAGVRVLGNSTVVNPTGTWGTYSLVFDSSTMPGSIGNFVGIELASALPTPDRSYLGIDNVRLAVPEPASLGLLSCGLAAWLLRRRHQQ